MAEKALAGVRVLEYARFVAGPYCTKLLADLGAEVIKIESPGIGDEARARGPFLDDTPHPERSGLFLYLNTNKLGITLDPKTATGGRLFRKLVKTVDILVEDNPPPTMETLGLGYKDLKVQNPRLIMTSITPFGQTGPYAQYKALELNTFHGSGQGYFLPGGTQYLHRPPLKCGGFIGDCTAGLNAAIATLCALYAQGRNGLSFHIDLSKQESLMALHRIDLARYPYDGTVTSRAIRGPRPGTNIRCKDGYIEMTINEDHQWQRLMDAMDNPAWAKEERFKTSFSRAQNTDEVNALIEEWAADYTRAELLRKLMAKGCPIGPINTPKELLSSAQLEARGFFTTIDHLKAGILKYPSIPYKFSETPLGAQRPAPLLAQHNEEIYCQRLGYTRHALVKMRQAGII